MMSWYDSQFSRGSSRLNYLSAPALDIIGHQTFIIRIVHDKLSYRMIAHVSKAALFHVYTQNLQKVNPYAYCKLPTSNNVNYASLISLFLQVNRQIYF